MDELKDWHRKVKEPITDSELQKFKVDLACDTPKVLYCYLTQTKGEK
jgi:hypothetical protein